MYIYGMKLNAYKYNKYIMKCEKDSQLLLLMKVCIMERKRTNEREREWGGYNPFATSKDREGEKVNEKVQDG